ncbi:hypothetical protein CH293_11490 [Rhodococcus sp. 14-2470-1b]|nr:hypothetical protein CH293_11490 [Rhodococcus sp. 14-2470-1b]
MARVRRERNLTLRALSERLTQVGRPISNSSISQVETGARRVDVDDLLAFSIALDVSPNTLLMPAHYDGERYVNITGAERVSTRSAWHFLDGMRSLTEQSLDFVVRSQPPFMSHRQSVDSARPAPAGEPLRIARRTQSDGETVDLIVSVGYGDLIRDNDEDD